MPGEPQQYPYARVAKGSTIAPAISGEVDHSIHKAEGDRSHRAGRPEKLKDKPAL